MQREVVITSGARTAIGDFGGGLKDLPPTELGARVVREALTRAAVHGDEVDHVVFGNVHQAGPKDLYLARVVAVHGGVGPHVPALTVNRLCGSGLEAIISASQQISVGAADIAIAGGAENMSMTPYLSPSARFGQRMGDARMIDMLLGGLTDPFLSMPMGGIAEQLARQRGITRRAQDELALESHRRAAGAAARGYFAEQVLPLEMSSRKGKFFFDRDEHVRGDASIAEFASMKPAFSKEDGTVTPGNACAISDAAAAVALMELGVAQKRGGRVLGRLVAYAHVGVEPMQMGLGPVPATRKALQRAGLKITDLDVVESNEAFAAQAIAVMQELDLDPAKVNPNGSGISLGHPVGATGAIMVIKALYELHRTGGRYALVTTCIGGGQGIAAILERA
ncbi:beta-ketothiolase BktB [Achromobacter xylosoxidans]|uniref:beta-ketothiolase BktB n=1 Tax=Alcaligenes xylosoxydans xylosoxydans TaxID=85698 RepID=UPI0006C01093|nr:beta-ketothiolase BktB [Achromobacter xylosoxidans]MCH1984790.1 beta-ketothiolase BktB [Achromobacter xylosoxidans]MCH1997300.1 beta-ketothiolase BktB [Achromobacter xylosoxidans]MCH4584457.1 beta-ketothiolase BktB [Achromobacter xylosoxidans]CUI38894.1 Beta-ketothiolase BktB [Achromobacter xylosoxidans]